jgi:hypothetical protein
MGTIKTTNIETITGSGTLTLGQSGETITIPSGVTITNNGTQTGFGGTNTPAFLAYLSSNQSLSSGAITKIQFDTEIFDTDGCYDNATNYRFTPTTAGKYLFLVNVRCYGNAGTLRYINLYLRKNGGTSAPDGFGNYSPEDNGNNFVSGGVHHSAIFDMNGTTDYIESYVQCQATSPNIGASNNGTTTTFMGYKLIGV